MNAPASYVLYVNHYILLIRNQLFSSLLRRWLGNTKGTRPVEACSNIPRGFLLGIIRKVIRTVKTYFTIRSLNTGLQVRSETTLVAAPRGTATYSSGVNEPKRAVTPEHDDGQTKTESGSKLYCLLALKLTVQVPLKRITCVGRYEKAHAKCLK